MNKIVKSMDVGSLISGSIDRVKASSQTVIVFVGALTAIGFVSEYTATNQPGFLAAILSLAAAVAALYGGYWLLKNLLADAGELTNPSGFWPYLLAAIVVGIAVAIGLLLLILPGLFLAARWSLALPLVVGRSMPLGEALSTSWDRTADHWVNILLAGLALVVVFLVIAILLSLPDRPGGAAILISQLFSNTAQAVSTAFSVVLLMRLVGNTEAVGKVFD